MAHNNTSLNCTVIAALTDIVAPFDFDNGPSLCAENSEARPDPASSDSTEPVDAASSHSCDNVDGTHGRVQPAMVNPFTAHNKPCNAARYKYQQQ